MSEGTERVIRIGVIGMGRGRCIAEGLSDPRLKLVAICDRKPEVIDVALGIFRERGLQGLDALERYDNFEDFIKADMDAVYIATDAVCHVPYAIKALDAGKHVISEIPAVNSLEEAKELRAAVKAHPELKYMCGENCCFWAFVEMWKQMYEDGKFGDIVYAEAEYLHAGDFRKFQKKNWEGHWRSYNPAIKYLTHELGPLLYIMNDKCVSVSCMVPKSDYNPYKTNDAQNGVALFRTAKGAVIRILICFGAYVGYDHNYELIGTRGTIETDKTKNMEQAHSFARLAEIPGTMEEKMEIPIGMAFPGEHSGGHGGAEVKMFKAFVDCILNDTEPTLNVDMAIGMALPGILACESAQNGGNVVEIPDPEQW